MVHSGLMRDAEQGTTVPIEAIKAVLLFGAMPRLELPLNAGASSER